MEFKTHFRMKRATFIFVLELLTPHLQKHSEKFGRHPITPEKQLLIAIWMMATPNSYRCVSDRFGIGRATAWRSVMKVVNALYYHLHTFIKWPSLEEVTATWTTIKIDMGSQKY
ncbi:uncharacterized protein LOC114936009 [Nylanderia fulva]|uniref:uncharacterized protein LOC114936009 n=1 Tax=Nylanderia fulva TaxID=613905 RepID=UPI0010FB6F8A|nr:uncharacterized protein LOC114936009 [Nylanderia fulva]